MEIENNADNSAPEVPGESFIIKDVDNADNSALEALGVPGSFIIGYVEEVNGKSAHEVPEFVPTRAELLELIKYWESVHLREACFVFESEQIGSSEMRLIHFARLRVARIVGLLGQDAIGAVDEARKGFGREVGHRRWRRFVEHHGLPEYIGHALD